MSRFVLAWVLATTLAPYALACGRTDLSPREDPAGAMGDGGDESSSSAIVLGASDAGPCAAFARPPSVLVCFGSDPAPYVQYLKPDGSVLVGQCPMVSDFQGPISEGTCGYAACGPVSSEAGAGGAEGGTDVDGPPAADSCCFWLLRSCGI